MSTIATIESARAFERHRDEVYRWAFRLVGRHHEALDVAQDVFVKWIEASRSESVIDQPRAWLRRVTINRAIDVVRARTTAIAAAIDSAEPRSMEDASGAIERAELRRQITLAMEGLTDMQRGVLIAKTFDDLSFAQVAEEMNIAIPTVKTHYLRAVSAVRDRLAHHRRMESI